MFPQIMCLRILRRIALAACLMLPGIAHSAFGTPPLATPQLQDEVLDERLHHLRNGDQREWSEFPIEAESQTLRIRFRSEPNSHPRSIRLRQQDVKQAWELRLNDRRLGRLPVNENDMRVYFDVPANGLVAGMNEVVIQPAAVGQAADDIRVGELVLQRAARDQVLGESTLVVRVREAPDETPLPCRLTLLAADGALQSLLAEPAERLAIRPGIVYTPTGDARLRVPSGRYTLIAGRGFEYSQQRREISLEAHQTREVELTLEREVPIPGFVACDTHVHSLTHSGHGDATVQERMITLAGEGIELPIATDHNVQIDHEPFAEEMEVRQYFTPVIGNEVTTRVGHFNVFPVHRGAPAPDAKRASYAEILQDIYATPGVKVAILNHARDLHSGVRPFGPRRHHALVGENLAGWHLGFNAMEVINSGATQTQPLQLLHDWFGLLNSGKRVTPVGSSDSHDVARHFVGQGRTYVRCDDSDPARIDVEQAVNNFLGGRVLVSYGLLVDLTVADKYGCGELVRAPAEVIQLEARVLGPHWTRADRLLLFANGQLLREAKLDRSSSPKKGVLATQTWSIPRPAHDVFLVAVALGPGIRDLAWPTAKPYQPTSPDWQPRTWACTGPVWLDVDRDGRRTSARTYAERLLAERPDAASSTLARLADYDRAVSAQAAYLLQQRHAVDLLDTNWTSALEAADDTVAAGFRDYLTGWRAFLQASAGGDE